MKHDNDKHSFFEYKNVIMYDRIRWKVSSEQKLISIILNRVSFHSVVQSHSSLSKTLHDGITEQL